MDFPVGGSNCTGDYLTEYRNISNKLKKRFLRRPNVSEASEQFARLAKKLESQEEPQYEASCYLAVAKCEQSVSNQPGEMEANISAARAFFKAETNITSINCNSLQQHLTNAISSYCKAIRILEEMGNSAQASGLCLEVGDKLQNLSKVSEAARFYQRAADIRSGQNNSSMGLEYVQSRQKVASCLINMGDYHNALVALTEIATITQNLVGQKVPANSVYADILCSCEILRVLLVLLIDPTPQAMSATYTNVIEKYAWESDSDNKRGAKEVAEGGSHPSYLPEQTFLLLQSVVMAVQLRDAGALAELEDCLVLVLEEMPQQRELLRKLVTSTQQNW